MVKVEPRWIDAYPVIAVEVQLPKTTLLVLQSNHGYIMCGALDIQLLRDKLAHRGILAARAIGVRTLDELMDGTIESCTQAAESIGIVPGMPVQDAMLRIIQQGNAAQSH